MSMPSMPNNSVCDTRIVRWARTLSAAGLALFLLVGLCTNLRATFLRQLDLLPGQTSWPAFLSGQTTATISSALSAAPVPELSARLQRGLGWEVLADLGPQVREGCPGWLFIADELRVHTQGAKDMAYRANVLARMQQALKARNIELLVATVPDKSRIERSLLCGVARPAALETRLQDWHALLDARGIASIDLEAALDDARRRSGQAVFLRTDTHWNEIGAEAAAQAVAAWIRERQIQPVPPQRWRQHTQPAQLGDLIRLAGLEQWKAHRPLLQDQVQASHFEPAGAEPPRLSADDLFGDVQTPNIVLIGTSFSNPVNSNFGGFLEERLQARIGLFFKDGGNFDGAAREYFPGETFRQNPPQLLIWEIPERVLPLPHESADREELHELLPRSP